MRKLRIGSQPELYDALSLLWKMLDGEEASETRSRNTEKEKVGEKDNWHIPKSLTYLNSDGNQQKDDAWKNFVVREITQVGALQLLLIALQKCQREGWVDVEMSIAQVLSVLVAHGEKDSQFLLNNAMNILSTLHTSLTGATDRDKAERRSRANSLITLESRGGDSTTSEVLMLTSKQTSDTKEIALDSTMSTSGAIPGALPHPQSKRQVSDSDETEESHHDAFSGEIHSSAALALNRICAVLAKEWEKQSREEANLKNNSPKSSLNERSSGFDMAYGHQGMLSPANWVDYLYLARVAWLYQM